MIKFLLLLFCFNASALSLPSHFGTELKLRAISPSFNALKDYKEVFKDTWTIEVDIASTKIKNDTIYLTAVGKLGKETSGLGGSAFYKINEFLFIGGQISASGSFDLKNSLIFLFSGQFNELYVEPFILARGENKSYKGVGGGVRFYYNKKFSFTTSIDKHAGVGYHIMIKAGVPFKSFSFIDELLSATKKEE